MIPKACKLLAISISIVEISALDPTEDMYCDPMLSAVNSILTDIQYSK